MRKRCHPMEGILRMWTDCAYLISRIRKAAPSFVPDISLLDSYEEFREYAESVKPQKDQLLSVDERFIVPVEHKRFFSGDMVVTPSAITAWLVHGRETIVLSAEELLTIGDFSDEALSLNFDTIPTACFLLEEPISFGNGDRKSVTCLFPYREIDFVTGELGLNICQISSDACQYSGLSLREKEKIERLVSRGDPDSVLTVHKTLLDILGVDESGKAFPWIALARVDEDCQGLSIPELLPVLTERFANHLQVPASEFSELHDPATIMFRIIAIMGSLKLEFLASTERLFRMEGIEKGGKNRIAYIR